MKSEKKWIYWPSDGSIDPAIGCPTASAAAAVAACVRACVSVDLKIEIFEEEKNAGQCLSESIINLNR